MKKRLRSYFKISIGVIFVAIAYYFMFLPQNIVTGGVTGTAIILNEIFEEEIVSTGTIVFLFNMLFLLLGLIFLGKEFFLKTLYGSILLPLIITVFEILNISPDFLFTVDQNILSVSETMMNPISQIIFSLTFGSILTGIGLGLCFKEDATTGGMDVLQKIIAKFFHFPYSKTVYITDGILVSISFFIFGIEITMYSLIAIFLIGFFIDMIYMGGSSRRTAFILSKHSDVIKEAIIDKLGRGVTVVSSKGGYSGDDYEMLICTLSRTESYVMRDIIYANDPNAFTFFVSAKEVYGDGFEKQ